MSGILCVEFVCGVCVWSLCVEFVCGVCLPRNVLNLIVFSKLISRAVSPPWYIIPVTPVRNIHQHNHRLAGNFPAVHMGSVRVQCMCESSLHGIKTLALSCCWNQWITDPNVLLMDVWVNQWLNRAALFPFNCLAGKQSFMIIEIFHWTIPCCEYRCNTNKLR